MPGAVWTGGLGAMGCDPGGMVGSSLAGSGVSARGAWERWPRRCSVSSPRRGAAIVGERLGFGGRCWRFQAVTGSHGSGAARREVTGLAGAWDAGGGVDGGREPSMLLGLIRAGWSGSSLAGSGVSARGAWGNWSCRCSVSSPRRGAAGDATGGGPEFGGRFRGAPSVAGGRAADGIAEGAEILGVMGADPGGVVGVKPEPRRIGQGPAPVTG